MQASQLAQKELGWGEDEAVGNPERKSPEVGEHQGGNARDMRQRERERDVERASLLLHVFEVKARESLSANELEAGSTFLKYVAALLCFLHKASQLGLHILSIFLISPGSASKNPQTDRNHIPSRPTLLQPICCTLVERRFGWSTQATLQTKIFAVFGSTSTVPRRSAVFQLPQGAE